MADVTQTDDADHPLALVDHRQPADLQRFHVMHRFCEVIILPAAMDAFGHDIPCRGAAGIEFVACEPFANDVAVGHHPEQPVVLADRNAADVMLLHQFRDLGDRGVGADPVDTLMHYVSDFHGEPPLGFQVRLMQCSTTPLFSTIQPIWCEVAGEASSLRDWARQTPQVPVQHRKGSCLSPNVADAGAARMFSIADRI